MNKLWLLYIVLSWSIPTWGIGKGEFIREVNLKYEVMMGLSMDLTMIQHLSVGKKNKCKRIIVKEY
jgi:hypothetical protein